MTSKERLEQYIKEDKVYNDWLDENTSYVSDFDRFCIQHCEDIKCLLEENEKLKQWDNNKDSRNSRQRVANAKLLKENQKLRKKLDEYENPEDMTLMMMWCTEQAKDKIKELEKQLEDKEDYINKLQATKDKLNKWDKENAMQQNAFIKYLEDEIKIYENDIQNFSKDYKVYFSLINDLRVSKATIEEILQKYKSIIGDDK